MTQLQLTQKQLTGFDDSRFQDFRELMVKHLREQVGGDFATQSDDDLLKYVDTGVTKAKSYGATENEAFGMYIVMMTEFGDDFDSNSEYPWAQDSLTDKTVKDANDRIRNTVSLCSFYLSNLNE